jgi:hypothetical protein
VLEEVIVPEMGVAAGVFRLHIQKDYSEPIGSRKWAVGIMMSSETFGGEERRCGLVLRLCVAATAIECDAVSSFNRDMLFVFTLCCLWLELAYPEELQGTCLSWRLIHRDGMQSCSSTALTTEVPACGCSSVSISPNLSSIRRLSSVPKHWILQLYSFNSKAC